MDLNKKICITKEEFLKATAEALKKRQNSRDCQGDADDDDSLDRVCL